jgi:tetrathionate reductase subunit A
LPFKTTLEEALLTGGSICAIGGSGVQALYNPFRIAKPLKRVGARGSGKWKSLGWNEAISEIVNGGDLFGEGHVRGLGALKKAGSGLTFVVGDVDWGGLTFMRRFAGAFPGAVLARDREAILRERRCNASDLIFGSGTGPVDADYSSARFVLSFGDAPLDSGVPIVSVARKIADARVAGAGFKWAVVDPRLSTSASRADMWVPVIPGKDMELALGIVRALLDEQPAKAATADEKIKKAALAGTVAEFSQACGLPRDAVLHLARSMADAGPFAAAIPGDGVIAQPNGVETAAVVLSLNKMVGSAPGAGGLVRNDSAFLAQAEKKLLDGARPVSTSKLSFDSPAPALMLWEADPVYDDPQRAGEYFNDRRRVGLFVAIEREITETTALADYVLPDTTYLERWDICGSPPSAAIPGFGFRSPVVGKFEAASGKYYPILPETRVMEDILYGLAAQLNLAGFEPDAGGAAKTAWAYWANALNVVLASMKESGLEMGEAAKDLSKIIDRGGVFAATSPGARPASAASPSASVDVKPPDLKRGGSARVGEELILLTYALPFHRSPKAGLSAWLLEVLPENKLQLNVEDARSRGIADLDLVVIETPDGKTRVECRAQVLPGIRPGVAALARGFGYTQRGGSAQSVDHQALDPIPAFRAGINAAGLTRITVRRA